MPSRNAASKAAHQPADPAPLQHSARVTLSRRSWLVASVLLACAPSRAVVIPPNAPRIGARSPKLVVQEIGDYECSFCAEVVPTVDALVEKFGDRVAFVWRNYPLDRHPSAMIAAESAVEVHAQAGDAGFWKYHHLLFANQMALEPPDLEKYAAKIPGVDLARFRDALKTHSRQPDVLRDQREVDALGVDRVATRMFYADGDAAVGAYPFDALSAWIEAHL